MRKLVGSALLASAVLSTAALATNGDNMIGVSQASRAMGGIGVGASVGTTDAIFRNPAWMSAQKGFNVSFGGILFMPEVKGRFKGAMDTDDTNNAANTVMQFDSGYVKSKADTFTIPEIGIVNKINDSLTVGVGAFGVSGMGVDYRDQSQFLNDMHTNFQFMRIIPAISYEIMPGLSIGGAIDLAWGALDIGATMCMPSDTNGDGYFDDDGDMVAEMGTCWNASGGQSQSLGLGVQLGIAYSLGMFDIGLNYQSSVGMKYKKVFDSNGDGTYEDLKLEQPSEIAIGIGVKPLSNLKIGLDVRRINWSKADGYKQFQWDDQTVFAIGGEYKLDKLALRVGYNYGKTPIKGQSNLDFGQGFGGKSANSIPDFAVPFSDFNVAWFNLLGFPAISEQHITLGAGYQFTKNFTLNISYVYSPSKNVESDAGNGMVVAGAKNAQQSIGVGLDWSF